MRFLRITLFFMLAAPACAQNLKLTSGGNATLTGATTGSVTTQSVADAMLTTTVNFGEVGPQNPNAYVCLTQPLFLRAFVPSSLHVAVTASSFPGGAGALVNSDIGVGIRNLAATGPQANITTSTIVGAFSSDPCAAPKSANGIPTYTATLASVAAAAPGTTVLQSTGAISSGGSLNAGSNIVSLNLRLAIVPQAFRAGSFSATVTITLTNP